MTDEAVDWYQCDIDRKALRDLMGRTNWVGLVWLAGHLGLLVVLGYAAYALAGTAAGVGAFISYGAVYGFFEAIRHETHHGTPFRSQAINRTVHWIAGFFGINEPLSDRWLHTAHHSHTYDSARDPEIQTSRPPNFLLMFLDLFRLAILRVKLRRIFGLAFGYFEPALARVVPESERAKVIASARAMLLGYAAIFALALAFQSWWPLLLTFGARISGAWLHTLILFTQHTGLPENVNDHRLNSRTIRTNPVLQFLYWNMNYHVEHHMFPLVPFYNLPALHRKLRSQMPPPYQGFTAAWAEILPALIRQRREPDYFARRGLHPLEAE
jgi:fatty acid desaturase